MFVYLPFENTLFCTLMKIEVINVIVNKEHGGMYACKDIAGASDES